MSSAQNDGYDAFNNGNACPGRCRQGTARGIFSNPSAHGVETISAQVLEGPDFACLTLYLKGVRGIPADGYFKIFGSSEMLDKFTELKSRINEIFAEQEVYYEAAE